MDEDEVQVTFYFYKQNVDPVPIEGENELMTMEEFQQKHGNFNFNFNDTEVVDIAENGQKKELLRVGPIRLNGNFNTLNFLISLAEDYWNRSEEKRSIKLLTEVKNVEFKFDGKSKYFNFEQRNEKSLFDLDPNVREISVESVVLETSNNSMYGRFQEELREMNERKNNWNWDRNWHGGKNFSCRRRRRKKRRSTRKRRRM